MKATEFEQKLGELRPDLFRFTKKFVQTREDSLDLVQETMLRALNYRSHFRENKNLTGWLYIIMRNTFINQYRKNSQSKNKTLGDSGFNLVKDYSTRKSDEHLHIDEVWKAINSISQELGKPFKMYLSGYKYDEIASALNVPIGTVKSRIFLARKEIRNQLPGYC